MTENKYPLIKTSLCLNVKREVSTVYLWVFLYAYVFLCDEVCLTSVGLD